MKAEPKPTDIGLPLWRKTHSWAIAISVGVCLLVGVVLVFWGTAELAQAIMMIDSGDNQQMK